MKMTILKMVLEPSPPYPSYGHPNEHNVYRVSIHTYIYCVSASYTLVINLLFNPEPCFFLITYLKQILFLTESKTKPILETLIEFALKKV